MAKVNKVNPKENGKKEEKEKGRVDFSIKDAKYRDKDGNVVTAVNGDGLLVAVPVPIKDADGKILYAGYNARKHLPLKKSEFASITEYLRYQAFVARIKAAILVKNAEEKEAKANRIEKFGDEATRKKAQRVAKMREQLAALENQLKSEGVNVDEI